MKKWVIFTTLLLVSGCTANNANNKQITPRQTNIESHAPNNASNSVLKQASSTSTADAGKATITTKEVPNEAPYWLDWFGNSTAPGGNTNTVGRSASPQQPADSSAFAQQVLDLVNKERSNAGLKPLSMNSSLSNVAMLKAKDMYNNNYFDHQSPSLGSPFDMMRANGITYSTAGENIAKGQTSPTEVMNQWMNSPGHRANILNSGYTQIGIAYYNSEWVQEFIG